MPRRQGATQPSRPPDRTQPPGITLLAALRTVLHDASWPLRWARQTIRRTRLRIVRRGGRLTWRGRVLLALTTLPITPICAAAASADDATGGRPASGALASFDALGASGIRISQYELSIYDGSGRFNAVIFDSGNPVIDVVGSVWGTIVGSEAPDPIKMFYAAVLGMMWDFYRLIVGVSLWLYQLATGYGWMDWLVEPARIVADAFQEVLAEIGLRPLALSIAGLVCVVWMARGRWAAGVSQLFLSLVIAALATGVLAHPVDRLAGPEGALKKAHQFGLQLSAVISSGAADSCVSANATTAELQKCTSGQIVDILLRGPHQVVNYGANIDADGKCRAVYDEVLKQGLWGDDPTPRSRMAQCKVAYGDYAYGVGPNQIATLAVVGFGGWCLLLFMAALTLVLLIASLTVVWEAVKLVINLIKAILPGASRGSLYQGIAQVGAALAVTVAAQVVLSVYVLALQKIIVSTARDGVDPNKTFLIIDLVILSATVVLIKYRAAARRSARHFADRLTALGTTGPTRLPAQGHGLRTALSVAG
ncbi:MAG TPA: hypothetical protein VJ739_14795, partial [Gemmataceae bacterium]|nr:hypothetical protein [Gemmataceae bacterium]